jgi:hypothetical protein
LRLARGGLPLFTELPRAKGFSEAPAQERVGAAAPRSCSVVRVMGVGEQKKGSGKGAGARKSSIRFWPTHPTLLTNSLTSSVSGLSCTSARRARSGSRRACGPLPRLLSRPRFPTSRSLRASSSGSPALRLRHIGYRLLSSDAFGACRWVSSTHLPPG